MTTERPTESDVRQMPTLPGKTDGIVGLDPLVLQCRTCGDTYEGSRGVAIEIILSGFHFHVCDGRTGTRKCPRCLQAAIEACGSARCAR